jgi:hypothetical protein
VNLLSYTAYPINPTVLFNMEDLLDFDPATIDSLDLQPLSNFPLSEELELFNALVGAIGSDAESPMRTSGTGGDQESATTKSGTASSELGRNIDEGEPKPIHYHSSAFIPTYNIALFAYILILNSPHHSIIRVSPFSSLA